MAAKLKITNVKIDAEKGALRVDLQFKATVGLEAKEGASRDVFANETHYFINNLAAADETKYTHALPAAWRKGLQELLAQLTDRIADYIS